ncbi:hypothetical protein MKW98_019812 [Papaver atlanticum]|uniref:Uncharacterized protein n=1 Tax=Papaver atlanticum TaxID=357466 RepID=A0AAD4TCM1_9MAGN|nr:hypothetical protein MKW98_019812 [Papaver atlanticum]
MSSAFRGAREADIESGFNGVVPGQTELLLHMPSSLTIAAKDGLQGLRLQLALLGLNFDELGQETQSNQVSGDAEASPRAPGDELTCSVCKSVRENHPDPSMFASGEQRECDWHCEE